MWKQVTVGIMQTNCYLLLDGKGFAWIIDPGAEPELIIRTLEKAEALPRAVFFTHGHLDHIAAASVLCRHYSTPDQKLPLLAHKEEANFFGNSARELHRNQFARLGPSGIMLFEKICTEIPDIFFFSENPELLAEAGLTEHHTPGHSRGSVVLYHEDEGILFSGDTLFCPGYGRTDLEGGNFEDLKKSLTFIMERFPPETKVLPGHGESGRLGNL